MTGGEAMEGNDEGRWQPARAACHGHVLRYALPVLMMLALVVVPSPSVWGDETESPAVQEQLAESREDASPSPLPEATDEATSARSDGLIATRNVFQVIRDGGIMMLPIVACSFLLVVFVFERTISLRRGRVIPRPFVHRILDQISEDELKPEEALDLCRDNASPVAEVFAAAIKKWGRPSVEVEQAVLDTGERVASRLRKHLRLFHGISTVGPLLGLLGTVLGMIQSFNAVAESDAMGKPELLALGISQALLTTAGGLVVAIPAMVTHMFFVGRVDGLILEIDALGQKIVNAIASDGWRDKREKKVAKPAKAKEAKEAKAA